VTRGEVSFAKVVRSAELGSAKYQVVLGYMYETGRGVPQDYHLAAFWYRQVAEQGNVRAQHLVGLLYDRGGVPLDYVEAHKWVNLAGGEGFQRRPRLLRANTQGGGVEINAPRFMTRSGARVYGP